MYNLAFNVYAGNNVFSNCKEYCLAMVAGGNATFIHCTFANFWTKDARSTPCVHVDNHAGSQQIPLDTCYFGNCIIDGNTASELELDIINTATFTPKDKFSYCFIKTTSNLSSNPTVFVNCNTNGQNSGFNNTSSYDFSLITGSNAINMGNGAMTDAALFPADIKLNNRLFDGSPDAGAYEK